MSDFNLPLLRKAVEWAESEARKPEEESEWCQDFFAMPGHQLDRTCGTAFCIAGYVAHIEGGLDPDKIDGTADELAQKLLGIDYDDAWSRPYGGGLFVASNTIEDVREIAENIAQKHGEEL